MHSKCTELAFKVLDPQTQAIWIESVRDLIEEYCFWPDQWFDPGKHARIDPYQLIIDGLPFHYPPIDHVEEEYAYWRMDGAGAPQPVDFGAGFCAIGKDDLNFGGVRDNVKSGQNIAVVINNYAAAHAYPFFFFLFRGFSSRLDKDKRR